MSMLRVMAIALALLVLAITTLSAFIRLSRAGLGCEPWPQCQARVLRAERHDPPAATGAVGAARVAHRATAVAALLLIIVVLVRAHLAAAPRRHVGRLALALLGLAVFLAVLGRMGADSPLPAVVLGNLLAGFAMVAASWRLVAATGPGGAGRGLPRRWLGAGLALLALQVALGGLVSAQHAGASCPQLAGCDLSAATWRALDPWHQLPPEAGGPAGALLHVLHRLAALAAVVALLPLGVAAWRRGHPAGAALLALLAAQVATGAWVALGWWPLALALAHNVLGALLVGTLAALWPAPAAND